MGYKPAKWPTYANDGLEDALSLLEDIERQMAKAQRVAEQNNAPLAVQIANTRVAAIRAHSTLIQAKAGEYRRLDDR